MIQRQNKMAVFLNKVIYPAILAIVFFLPAYLIRFKIFGLPTTLLEVLIYILFLLWLAKQAFNGDWRITQNIELNRSNKLLFIGLSLFIGGALIASLFSSNKEASFGLLKAYFFDPFLFFIVAVYSLKIKNISAVLKTYLFSALGVSVLAFFYFLGGELTYDGRLQGIFNSPNFLAMYITPAIIIGLWQLFSNTHTERSKIWFHRFISAFLIFILYLTTSYGAFLGIILAAFFILFLQSPNLWKSDFHRLGVVAVILLLFAFQWPTDKFQKLLSFSPESSITQRIYIWKASASILKDNFLLGIGPGMFQEYYQFYALKNSTNGMDLSVPYPHNIFLAFFIQNGLIGGIGFLLLLFWYVKSVFEIFKSEQKKYAVLFGAFLVYFLVHGMTDTLYWKNDLSLLFFVFLSAVFIVRNEFKKLR